MELEIWVNESVGVSDYVYLPGWLKVHCWDYIQVRHGSYTDPGCKYIDFRGDCARVQISSQKISRYESVAISEYVKGYVIKPVRPFAVEEVIISENTTQGAFESGFLGSLRRLEMERVFLGHNNFSALLLTVSGNPVGTSSFTKVELKVKDTLVSSTNAPGDPIRWNQVGYLLGEVRLFLGFEALEPGVFNAPLIVYSTSFPNGVVWDKIRLLVYDEVESEPLPILPGDGLSISEYVNVGIV